MRPRHCLYIGLGLMAGVISIFFIKGRFTAPDLDCIIQPDRVVLNSYDRRGDLRQSVSIAGNDVTIWHRGQLKPVVRKNQQIWKNTHSQNYEGEYLMSIYTGSAWHVYGYASPKCYEAISVFDG